MPSSREGGVGSAPPSPWASRKRELSWHAPRARDLNSMRPWPPSSLPAAKRWPLRWTWPSANQWKTESSRFESQLGGIDILVNNAGMNVREPIEEVTEAHYDQIMAVNLKGLFFLTQSVIPHLKRKGGGKIINIGSITTGYGLTSIPGLRGYERSSRPIEQSFCGRTRAPQHPGQYSLSRLCSHPIDQETMVGSRNEGLGRASYTHRSNGHAGMKWSGPPSSSLRPLLTTSLARKSTSMADTPPASAGPYPIGGGNR